MHNQPKLPAPSLFSMKMSGSFEIPAETFDLIDAHSRFMFVVVGHLVGESRNERASGDIAWSGRLRIDDAVRVASPELRQKLFKELGLAGEQGSLDDELPLERDDDEPPTIDLGEPATPVPTPPAANEDAPKVRPTPPRPAPPPAPAPVPPPKANPVDAALHAFLYGGDV